MKYYLVAYNALSALGWSYILVTLFIHLLGLPAASAHAPAVQTASSKLSNIFSALPWKGIPYLKGSAPLFGSTRVPAVLRPLLRRAASAYTVVGPETTLVQSFAILEVVHAALGWVRSPVQTTAMQVASRLFLVWGVAERFEVVRQTSIPNFFSSNLTHISLSPTYTGTHHASLRLHGSCMVAHRSHPLHILRMQSPRLRALRAPLAALHDVLCALPARCGF